MVEACNTIHVMPISVTENRRIYAIQEVTRNVTYQSYGDIIWYTFQSKWFTFFGFTLSLQKYSANLYDASMIDHPSQCRLIALAAPGDQYPRQYKFKVHAPAEFIFIDIPHGISMMGGSS